MTLPNDVARCNLRIEPSKVLVIGVDYSSKKGDSTVFYDPRTGEFRIEPREGEKNDQMAED